MIRRLWRTGIRLCPLAGLAVILLRSLRGRRPAGREARTPPRDWPPVPASEPSATPPRSSWVPAEGAGCPSTHPIKGKLSSGIYHLPGMVAYDRTRPDRCYAREADAAADGLRPAKR